DAKVSSARRTTGASDWAGVATTDSAANAASASPTMTHRGSAPLGRGRSPELLIPGLQAKIVALLGVSRSVVARGELCPILASQGSVEPRALEERDHGVEVGSLRREHRGDEGLQCCHPSGLMVESHDLKSTPGCRTQRRSAVDEHALEEPVVLLLSAGIEPSVPGRA